MVWLTARLAWASANGCIRAISWASAIVSEWSSSRGTTRLTMPAASASVALIRRAVNSISLALRGPSSQVWPWYSTPPMPMRATGSENMALSAAIIRSQGQQSINPPAMHWPCTSAMVGLGMSRQRRL